jgi:hypothetical protein
VANVRRRLAEVLVSGQLSPAAFFVRYVEF